MAQWKGAQTVAGMAYSGTTWGAEAACGTNSGFEFESESLTADAQFIPNTGISGNIAQIKGVKGNELHSGDIVIPGDYNTIDRFVAQVLGGEDSPSVIGSGYRHILGPANSVEGKHGTVVFGHSGLYVREYPTVKFTGFTMNCAAGEQAKFTFNCVPNKCVVDDSGTNKLATMTNITRPALWNYIEFNHLTVRLNTWGAAALSASDDQYISAISLTVTNNMRGDSVTTKAAPYTDEPYRSGWMEVTGTLTFGELTASTWLTDHLAKTQKKMTLFFTGPALGADYYYFEVDLGSVQFESYDDNVGGPELVAPTLNFRCSKSLATPTGMHNTDIIRVQIHNEQNRSALSGV